MDDLAVPLWAVATIGGPIVLGAILAYGVWRNRRRRKRLAASGRAPGEGDR